MGFNLGRFASGVAQGGLNTYMTLSDIEQKQKELALREEAAARDRAEYERRLAVDEILKKASAPEATVGTGQSMSSVAGALPIAPQGGQYDNPEYRQAFTSALSKMTPEQQESTLRQYGSVMPEGVGGAPAQQGGMRGAAVPARSAIDLGKATTYKGDDGQIYVTDKTRKRTQEEVSNRFMELAGESGSSLAMEKAMDYKSKQSQIDASKQALRVGEQNLELGAKQLVLADMSIGVAKREQNYRENLDKFSERTLKTQEILETLPNVGLKEAPGLVNGALKDFGLTAKYIEPTGDAAKKQIIGGVQMGTVEVRDSKGKVVGSFNSVAEIQGALNGQMEQYHNTVAAQLVQMLPNPADRIKFMNDAKAFTLEKAKVDIMGRQAASAEKSAETNAAELKAKIDAGLFGAQAEQAKGAAASSRAHANVYNNMAALSKSNAEAGKVMKPYIEEFAKLSPEDQAGAKGQSVLLEAATAAAKKTGDVTAIINALRKPDRSAVSVEERTAAYKELGEAGTNPEAVEAVKAKWSNVFGEDPLVTEFKEKSKNKDKNIGDKKTAIPITLPPTPPSAKQTEKALRDEWADLKARQKLVGASPEAKAKSALRIQEIEQTLNGVKPSNKLIKTD